MQQLHDTAAQYHDDRAEQTPSSNGQCAQTWLSRSESNVKIPAPTIAPYGEPIPPRIPMMTMFVEVVKSTTSSGTKP